MFSLATRSTLYNRNKLFGLPGYKKLSKQVNKKNIKNEVNLRISGLISIHVIFVFMILTNLLVNLKLFIGRNNGINHVYLKYEITKIV